MAVLYKPTYLYPDGIALDMTLPQTFTSLVNLGSGYIDSYKIVIYDADSNSVLYDTSYMPIGHAVYNGETLGVVIPANSVANGLRLKWTFSHQDNFNNNITSYETACFSATDPVFTITVPSSVTEQSFAFDGDYYQAENVALKWWYYVLYDSSNEIVLQTDLSYSGNIIYTYDGFVDGQTYKIKGFGETQQRKSIETPLYSFTVDYVQPSVLTKPTLTLNCQSTAVDVNLGNLYQLNGVTTGTTSYVNFLNSGNYGLQMNSGATLTYSGITIPNTFTYHNVFKFASTGARSIVELSNTLTSESILIGFDGTTMYKRVNAGYTYGANRTVSTSNYYLIFVEFNSVYIFEYGADTTTLISYEKI